MFRPSGYSTQNLWSDTRPSTKATPWTAGGWADGGPAPARSQPRGPERGVCSPSLRRPVPHWPPPLRAESRALKLPPSALSGLSSDNNSLTSIYQGPPRASSAPNKTSLGKTARICSHLGDFSSDPVGLLRILRQIRRRSLVFEAASTEALSRSGVGAGTRVRYRGSRRTENGSLHLAHVRTSSFCPMWLC